MGFGLYGPVHDYTRGKNQVVFGLFLKGGKEKKKIRFIYFQFTAGDISMPVCRCGHTG